MQPIELRKDFYKVDRSVGVLCRALRVGDLVIILTQPTLHFGYFLLLKRELKSSLIQDGLIHIYSKA
jgi:hypothetical protein